MNRLLLLRGGIRGYDSVSNTGEARKIYSTSIKVYIYRVGVNSQLPNDDVFSLVV